MTEEAAPQTTAQSKPAASKLPRLTAGQVKAKQPKAAPPKSDAPEITSLVDASLAARQDASARAEACARELSVILNKYNCRILPRLDKANMEPVGVAGDKVIITATFWIAPLAS